MTPDDLAKAHWEYIEDVMWEQARVSGDAPHTWEDVIRLVGFHFRTAMIHGWKHGVASETQARE